MIKNNTETETDTETDTRTDTETETDTVYIPRILFDWQCQLGKEYLRCFHSGSLSQEILGQISGEKTTFTIKKATAA